MLLLRFVMLLLFWFAGRFDAFSLGKPSTRDDVAIVGTDDPHGEDRKDHFMMCISLDLSANCLKSSLALDEVWFFFGLCTSRLHQWSVRELCIAVCVFQPVRDVHWVADDMVIAATGDGHVIVFHVDLNHKMTRRGLFVGSVTRT